MNFMIVTIVYHWLLLAPLVIITMIFLATCYVVLVVTTLNLCEFLVGKHERVDEISIESVASEDVNATAIVWRGQAVTKGEVVLSLQHNVQQQWLF